MRVRRAQLLDAKLGKPLTHVNGLLKRLALDNTSNETSGERVTGTVGVVDLVLLDGVYRNLLDISVTTLLCGHGNGWVGALSDDNSPRSLGVLFGCGGNLLRNLLDVLGLPAMRLGECGGFGLITDDNINIGENLIERVLEELRDEGCGKVKDELLENG